MVKIGYYLDIIMLEEGRMTYTEFCREVPHHEIPSEYKTYALFLKNRGKASKRINKEAEWDRLKWFKKWGIEPPSD